MKTLYPVLIFGVAMAVASCTHQVAVDDIDITKRVIGPSPASIDARKGVADQTCEAQYSGDRQNFLSAIQTVIASNNGAPSGNNVPLDRFRAEVSAAYNTVVARCKTHTNCLEVHRYDEAKCYISSYDRKDAERRFSDLSLELRQIEAKLRRQHVRKKGKKKPAKPSVSVSTTVNQTNKQNTTVTVGDTIEDQDVLVLCDDAKNLLDKRCRCQKDRCKK